MRRGGLWLQAANLLTATRLVAAGVLLFLLPLTRPFLPLKISAAAVCAVAGFVALQEGYRIRAKRQ